MANYRPLQGNISTTPTLYLDTEATASALLENAKYRINTVRNLLNSVSCLCVRDSEGHDLEHFASAAHILLQDGCDALDALGWKLDRVAPGL
ncbi:hypothetical protein [Pseudomonas sp.]|uniref:hypothetical protein n=1 Tax=Pseudomonas sp. TaxID=306 RepID=UPI002E2FFF26|nr:hypothetical protein [Pseudomonas sp.]HEX4551425.1 hypothetical protein [Pseudomonas sp.]